jgi:hypothetical protein
MIGGKPPVIRKALILPYNGMAGDGFKWGLGAFWKDGGFI